MNRENSILTIAFMNIQGQTKLPLVKQVQIEDFVKQFNIDIKYSFIFFLEPLGFVLQTKSVSIKITDQPQKKVVESLYEIYDSWGNTE